MINPTPAPNPILLTSMRNTASPTSSHHHDMVREDSGRGHAFPPSRWNRGAPRTITVIVLLSHPKYVDDLTCRSSSRCREKRASGFGAAFVLAAGRCVAGIRSRLSDGAAHAGSASPGDRAPDARLRLARLAGP